MTGEWFAFFHWKRLYRGSNNRACNHPTLCGWCALNWRNGDRR